jgi:hypothetical protein
MESLQKFPTMKTPAQEIAEEIFRRKQVGRREAAQLPVEEKLRILVEMQNRAKEIRRAVGRPEMFVWQLDDPMNRRSHFIPCTSDDSPRNP